MRGLQARQQVPAPRRDEIGETQHLIGHHAQLLDDLRLANAVCSELTAAP
ncbi:hypothetical protein [Pseudonocardia sp. GCM10023141]